MKVEVLRRVSRPDKDYLPGETLIVDQQTAAILIGKGAVTEVAEPKQPNKPDTKGAE